VNFVLFTTLVERRDLIAADEQAERFGRVADLHAQVGGLRPIDAHRQLGFAGVQRGVHVDDAGHVLHPLDQLLADRFQFLEIGPVDPELDRRRLAAAAADDGDLLHRRARVGRERRQDLLPDLVHDRELVALARLDRRQSNVDGAEIPRLWRVARDRDQRVVDFRDSRPNRGGDAIGHEVRRLEAGAFRRSEIDFELALIVRRHEVLVRHHEQGHRREQDQDRDTGHHGAVRHRPFEQPRVEHVDGVKDPRVFRGVLVFAVRFDLQPPRRHHRRQGEAHEQRHQDRERHGQAEALHEAADDAAHEADRARRSRPATASWPGRPSRFLRRVNRGAELIVVLLLDEPIDVLQHDDRIVDDDAHREREASIVIRFSVKPMYQISPNVAMIDVGMATGGDDRRSQVGEEQQHDQRGENRPDDEMLFDVVDRRFDELPPGRARRAPCSRTARPPGVR
jgi:hypothetical protein